MYFESFKPKITWNLWTILSVIWSLSVWSNRLWVCLSFCWTVFYIVVVQIFFHHGLLIYGIYHQSHLMWWGNWIVQQKKISGMNRQRCLQWHDCSTIFQFGTIMSLFMSIIYIFYHHCIQVTNLRPWKEIKLFYHKCQCIMSPCGRLMHKIHIKFKFHYIYL